MIHRDDVKCINDPCDDRFMYHPDRSAYHWRPLIDISEIPSSKPEHLDDLDMAYDNCPKFYQKTTKVYRVYDC